MNYHPHFRRCNGAVAVRDYLHSYQPHFLHMPRPVGGLLSTGDRGYFTHLPEVAFVTTLPHHRAILIKRSIRHDASAGHDCLGRPFQRFWGIGRKLEGFMSGIDILIRFRLWKNRTSVH